MTRTIQQRAAIFTIALVLTSSACATGSDDAPSAATELPQASDVRATVDADEADRASDESTTTTAAPAGNTLAPDQWLQALDEALVTLRSEGIRNLALYTIDLQQTPLDPTVESANIRRSGEAHAALVEGLAQPPADLPEANALVAAASNLRDELWDYADTWDADQRLVGIETTDIPSDLWDEYELPRLEAELQFQEACLDLRDAAEEAGYGILDCVGADDPPFDDCDLLIEAYGDGFPCGNDDVASAPNEGPFAEGETVTFDQFPAPFSITMDEASEIVVTDTAIEIGPVASPESERRFEIMWIDQIADPARMESDVFALGETVPAPDDLGEWIGQIPIPIVAEGTSNFGELQAQWWRTEAANDPPSEDDVDFYAFADAGVSAVAILRRDTMLWQIPHPDGLLVVYAIAVFESPDAATIDEKFMFVEATLSSFEFAS